MHKKFVFNRFIIVWLLLFLLIVLSNSVLANSSLEKARESVVRVIVIDPATGGVVNFGSGFVVGGEEPFEYVATCARIIEQGGDIYIWRARDDQISAERYLTEGDIALLELDPRHLLYGYEPLELARKEMVSDVDEVYAIGFPVPSDEMVDFPAAFPEDTTVTKGIVEKGVTLRGVGAYQTSAAVHWGSSGGPLTNEDGQVIGVISRYAHQDGENAAVHVDYLTGALISRGIDFVPAQEEVVTETDPDLDPAPEVDEEPEVTAPVNGNGILGTHGPLIIGLSAAAFLIIVLALILVARKRKISAAMATPSAQQAAPAAGPVTMTRPEREPAVTQAKRPQYRAVIKGIAGQFFGQNLELVDNQLVIGRDPRLSQLIYPQDREEISRKHVTISFDERNHKFILEDSSSNGTYLSSNQKLEPGEKYYLNSGERFYLADPNEVFEVRVES